MAAPPNASRRAVTMAVLIAALGYFVDIYDLLLFSIVRVSSLKDLGLGPEAVASEGEAILQLQMFGMLLGGILWGVLGDRRGRLSVLFGSIVLYSLANIANGFVQDATQYRWIRFIAGLGLAGELGAGITLVSELMKGSKRGYGTAIVAAVGICGAIVASLVAGRVGWRHAYFIGGGMGLALLLLRVGTLESGIFKNLERSVRRGDFRILFSSWPRARRYLSTILIGLPIWYVIALLITFSREMGAAMGMDPLPNPAQAVMFSYAGLAVGDLGSGLLSQLMRSRKKVVTLFILGTAVGVALYFTVGGRSLTAFYACCALLGLTTGYWAVFVTVASEQFGTNIRATVTTTVPNFVRGAVVPIVALYQFGKAQTHEVGSALAVGAITLTVALVALRTLDETFGRDLDFIEE
jgi:predicted MFS family arabinose efflux permease